MLYTQLKKLESEIQALIDLGIVDPAVKRNLRIVESYFLLRSQDVCIGCCYGFISIDENISDEMVKKIIKKYTSKN
jgi:hypothetical protein